MPTAELPAPTPLPRQLDMLPDKIASEKWSQTIGQFARFGLVGCLNTLVDLLTLNCLLWLWPVQSTFVLLIANSLAYTLGAFNSFLLNRHWTFQRKGYTNKGEVLRFATTTLVGLVCNDLILCLLNSVQHPDHFSPTLWTNMTKVVAIGGTILISYLGMRLWVFVQPSQPLPGRSERGVLKTRTREQELTRLSEQSHAPELAARSLSLVLPAYNEEQIIAAIVEQAVHVLAELTRDFEVIVVNDGSTDQTGPILATLSKTNPRVRVVTHEQNQGYGVTLANGFAAASKELTFFMDSDGQFDIHDLARLLPLSNAFDAVIGYRADRQDTWIRKLNAWGWKQLVHLTLGVRARDIDCAFKVLRTDFLHAHPLETRGAMINAELLYKLKYAGCTVGEVSVHHLPRQGGRATGANLHVIGRAFRELFLFVGKQRLAKSCFYLPFSLADELSAESLMQKGTIMLDTETTTAAHRSTCVRKSSVRPPLQQRLALVAIMLTSIFMNFYQLGQHGFANLFYAAGVRSMADNLHNFFFASYDPGGFVTIDKPPVGFWLQILSVKCFGFTPFSLFLPQALAGVLATLVLFHLVRRHFGYVTGLLAALALALSPLSVATARNNTIDSTLVLALLLATWTIMRAAETGRWRWLLLSAALVGLGFNIKMMEAYLVIPAFGLLYLLAAPRAFWLRVLQLFVAVLVLLAVSLSWACVVDLTPASQRPYVGSS